MNKDSLGDRMKTYEAVSKTRLVRRMPVIIRIDGKAFHTFTRGFVRPFDDILMKTMDDTMKYLCENIQGCVLGYKQSDEISLLLVDYKSINTSAWFDDEVQKMCSIAASMATMAFNRSFEKNYDEYGRENIEDWDEGGTNRTLSDKEQETLSLVNTYEMTAHRGAMFDARVFNIPKEDVANYFLWRQNDATRNSIQSVGQANFSQRQLHGKSCNQIQDMLFLEKGINWNDYPTACKRGTCCIRLTEDDINGRSRWVIDKEIPIFKDVGRYYIESLIYFQDITEE